MSQIEPGSPPPAPIPVQPLTYSAAYGTGRPGVVTAIGVLCIIIACLSGICSLGTGFYGAMFYMLSRMSSAMSTVSMPVSSAAPVNSGTASSPSLSPAEAAAGVNALWQRLSLDGARMRELDRLLRRHGREIFSADDDTPMTAADVLARVKSTSSAANSRSPATFTTDQGTVHVYLDHAVFTSTDGFQTIDTSARHNFETVSGVSTSFSYHASSGALSTALTRAQVNQVVAAVQQQSPRPLTAAQVRVLRTELSRAGQQLVTPGAPAPVLSIFVDAGANAHITFSSGNVLVLGRGGQVISSGAMAFPRIRITGACVGTVIGEAVASFVLAIYLLVIGIMAFRPNQTMPRLLRIYAFLKIPLALMAGAGLSWLGYQLASGIAATMSGGSAAPMATGAIMYGSILTVVGLAFPIAVLIALQTRSVRSYYSPALPAEAP